MNAIVQFQAPRLPYHPVVEERFGIDKSGWKALVEAIFPAAESIDSVVMALAYCKARNLDVFKRPVHIVPVYDSKRRCMVETVWPGISELRTTAMRTGTYAGCDDMDTGPDVTRDLGGVKMTFPEWGQITVYKLVGGQRVPFVGPKVHWLETYATAKRDTDAPNTMWKKRPRGQLEKCAEAAALRRAYPEELGNEYAAEEMTGRVIGADGLPVAGVVATLPRPPAPKLHADFDEPEAPHNPVTGEVIDAEVIDPPHTDGLPIRDDTPEETPSSTAREPDAANNGAGGGGLTLNQRKDGYLSRLREAKTTIKLRSIREANKALRDDLDRADPEGMALEVEDVFNTLYAALDDAEKAARAGAAGRG